MATINTCKYELGRTTAGIVNTFVAPIMGVTAPAMATVVYRPRDNQLETIYYFGYSTDNCNALQSIIDLK